jgi:hypothetical protein
VVRAKLAEKTAREAGDLSYRFPKDAGPYSLRHTAIENLKAAGVALDVIHTLAGHKSLQTTMEHYNQPTDQRNSMPRRRSGIDSRGTVALRVALRARRPPRAADEKLLRGNGFHGAPGQNRTGNLGLRSPLLYPV